MLFTFAALKPDSIDTVLYIAGGLFLLITILFTFSALKLAASNRRLKGSEIIVKFSTASANNIVFCLLFSALAVYSWFIGSSSAVSLFLCATFVEMVIMFILIIKSGSALTAEGVYVNGRFYDWFNIHDYYVDKCAQKIVFSSHIKGGLTLKGLTAPLFFKAEDEQRLEEFLRKQSGKFLRRITIR